MLDPAPAGQEQHHLDTLQGMLNLIFLQSGRFIKEHQAGGGTGRMKLGMQRAVPAATERFHDALDELENEVRLAQTVLRRDLALLKQERRKKEAATKLHEAEKARKAAESRSAVSQPDMAEDTARPEKVATPGQPGGQSPAAQPAQPEDDDKSLKREEETVPPPIDTAAATAPTTTLTSAPERDPLFGATPTTANPHESEFDFDAMFGDTMDTSGDNKHNTKNSNDDDDMMDTSGDLNFSGVDDGGDGPSLLRGLEDFAKSSDDGAVNHTDMDVDVDVPMADLPELNASALSVAVAEQPVPAQPLDAPSIPKQQTTTAPVPQDAKVDTSTKVEEPKNDVKLPPPKEEGAGAGAGAGTDIMATMVADDLEDLFNMDEYPENSSFDDAFLYFDN